MPRRFSTVESDDGRLLRERLRVLLDRHRAAGISLRVEYADPRWTLGAGVLRPDGGHAGVPGGLEDPIGIVFAGTELWPDLEPPPVLPIPPIPPSLRLAPNPETRR